MWDQLPNDADWNRLTAALKSADSVLLIAHVNPDGDALGSAMAVGLALASLRIDVSVSFADRPFRPPLYLEWMPGLDLLVPPDDAPIRADVAVSFDVASFDRLGSLGPVARTARLFAAVDHHRSYTGFGDISLVDVSAPATAVLALDLVDRLGVELTTDIATCIYTGLTTDTGSFKFAGTTADTHRIAARLHEAGIEHDLIARAVFDDQSFSSLQLLGVALSKAKLDRCAVGGLGMISTQISRQDRNVFGLPLDTAESIIDVIRSVSQAEVAAVAKEGDDGVWRISTRSKGKVDLGAACIALGGGGHRFAAGFSAPGGPDDALASLRDLVTATVVTGENV